MKTDYKPIDCNYYDILTEHAIKQSKVEIRFNSNGKITSLNTRIKDIYTKQSEEFIALENGETIRLDKLIAVDGIALEGYSCKV